MHPQIMYAPCPQIKAQEYFQIPDISTSDHKPVSATFTVPTGRLIVVSVLVWVGCMDMGVRKGVGTCMSVCARMG